MAETLAFSLVSPARELFSGDVDHVIAPGSEGEFGVLPAHAPFMSTLKNGVVRVLRGSHDDMRIFVRGGFADVTPAGLTILAEEAVDLAETSPEAIDTQLETAQNELRGRSEDDGARGRLEERVRFLETLRAAI